MGEIHVAATGEMGGFEKLCVIKKVLTEKTDRGKANRFLDEAKVVLRLSHANLVLTFDAGDVNGEFYIAMELVEGKDLREIWNRCVRTQTRIPLDVALHVAREIARALSYVHSYGELHLVHRDVAPPNILLSYFGEVKLTDFGLARSVLKQEHTQPGVVFGRASYLAPEQARGEIADARTDVYSLGIVLWELLTGQQFLQLSNLDPVTALSLVRHPKPVPPSMRAPWITPELDALVMRALAPNRNLRFQSADDMRQALSEVITRSAPRADAERAAEFLRGLYGQIIKEERDEREHLLKDRLTALKVAAADEDESTVRLVQEGPVVFALSESEPPRQAAGVLDGDSVMALPTPPPILLNEREEPTRVWRKRESSSSAGVRLVSSSPTPPVPRTPAPVVTGDFLGRVIDGRYKILRQIGEGGMGTVYAGEHVEIGKGVAVKILHPVYSRQKDLVERFRREARAASRIGHPNIVDVTDFGTTEEGCAYFAMEHLDGIDLADVLSHERRIEPMRAVQIGIQVCRALHAAHAAGVIHRDLKPENIFLVARDGKADFVKVLDFGIARSLNRGSRRLTNPGMAMGTPEYMAPEQAIGGPADRRSDIYSVGALLYEMVVGTPPHAGIAHQEVMSGRMPSEPRLPSELLPTIPVDLEQIILHALRPDPALRYQTMAQLEFELTKSVFGRPRAVAELLGLREPSRSDTPSAALRERRSGTHERVPEELWEGPEANDFAPAVDSGLGAVVTALTRSSSSWTAAPVPASTSPSSGPLPFGEGTPMPRGGPHGGGASAGVRTWGSLAIVSLGVLCAVVAYRNVAWIRGEMGASAPRGALSPNGQTPAEQRAARLRSLEAQAEAMATGALTPAQVPQLQYLLAGLATEGARSASGRIAGDAAARLRKAAAAELDAGRVDAGIETYKMVLALNPNAAGHSELASVLRKRGEVALGDGRQEEAARWAREALKMAEADPDAHALLGAALAASRNWAAAADEYSKALSSRPDDRTLRRSLERMRQRQEWATRPRRPAAAAAAIAPPPQPPLPPPGEDSLMAPGTASATIEPAAQK